ncbi:MAG: NAD(P)/FAD-dependent oxidoreductase [Deltaproteobacteria bacterium]|nr:NAD(P)/FAD-dependent oxidoreductase [Deltaproteobacteria bacterium]
MGGSSAAAVLAHAGLRVLLLEKNPRLGGSCSYYQKHGFRIDFGTHMFSRGPRGPIGEVQRRIGLSAEQQVRFVRAPTICQVRGLPKPLVVPASPWRLPAFAIDLIRTLRLSPREVFDSGRLFAAMFTMTEAEIAVWDRRTIEQFILRYTDNPRLIGLLGLLLGLYFVLPFWTVSAGEAIWCFRQMVRDNYVSYPLGGSSAIPQRLCDAAVSHGATIRCNAEVVRIEPAGGDRRARIATRQGAQYQARAVVCTTSLKDLVQRLIGAEHFPARFASRVDGLRSSYVAVQCKIALRRNCISHGCIVGAASRVPGLKPHLLSLADYRRIFGELEQGCVPSVMPLYCQVPTFFDPSLAPVGRQLLSVCGVAPTLDVSLQQPERVWAETLLQAIDQLLPETRGERLFIDTISVRSLGSWIGKVNAPAISTAQTTDQVGARRPSVRLPVQGIYAAGDGAGGRGVGTELAVASGMLAADAVLEDLARALI